MESNNTSYNELTGSAKAAIFMLSLDQEHSAALFNLMDDDEIREITIAIAGLGSIDASIVDELLMEFTDRLSTSGPLVGSFTSAERLLSAGFDSEKVGMIMDEIRGPAGRTMWDKLGNVNEQVLANFLKNEYPQTVAVILSKIKSDHASAVLSVLPEDFAMEVVLRLLKMEPVQKEILDGIEDTLRREFMNSLAARSTGKDSHERMADIFNGLGRAEEDRFMNALESRNKESAERIKGLMFTFDDLIRVDPTGVQVLLRQVDKDQLATGLKGANEELQALFFTNMSERAGKMMKEDMEAMGPVRMKDVQEAQSAIVSLAKQLSDDGEIVIAGGGGEDELVF
jgi:flagellar motor switch protein FliG